MSRLRLFFSFLENLDDIQGKKKKQCDVYYTQV